MSDFPTLVSGKPMLSRNRQLFSALQHFFVWFGH
jgi:hypothetical protein